MIIRIDNIIITIDIREPNRKKAIALEKKKSGGNF